MAGGEIVKTVKTLKTATPKATKRSVRPHTEADAADSDSTKEEVRSSVSSGEGSRSDYQRRKKHDGKKRKRHHDRNSSSNNSQRRKRSHSETTDSKMPPLPPPPPPPPPPAGLDPKVTDALVLKLSGDVTKLVKQVVEAELKRLAPTPSKSDDTAIKAVCSRVADAVGDGLPNFQMEARISQLVRDALAQYATDQAALRASVTSQLARMEASLATVASAATDAAAAATAAAQEAELSRRAATASADSATEHGEQAKSIALEARRVAEAAMANVSQNSSGGGPRMSQGSSGSARSVRRYSRSRSRSPSRGASRQRSRSRDHRGR